MAGILGQELFDVFSTGCDCRHGSHHTARRHADAPYRYHIYFTLYTNAFPPFRCAVPLRFFVPAFAMNRLSRPNPKGRQLPAAASFISAQKDFRQCRYTQYGKYGVMAARRSFQSGMIIVMTL